MTVALVGAAAVSAFGIAAYAARGSGSGESAALDGFALHNARVEIEALVRYDPAAIAVLVPATWTAAPPRKPPQTKRWLPEDAAALTLQANVVRVKRNLATIELTLQDPLRGSIVETTTVAADVPPPCDPVLRGVVC